MLPEGKTAGGAPVNFIYHAMQDGVDGYSVSALGNDQLGSELEETVRKAGIPYYFERNDYPTGTAGIMAGDDDTFSYSITEGAAWDHLRETDEVQKIISRADGITYGTLALRSPESRQTILNLIDDAPTSCLRFFDVNLRGDYYDRDLIDQLLRLSTHFKMNQSEFAFLKSLLGMEEANEDGMDDEEACAWFFRHYPNLRMIAMTAGRSYSLVMSADGRASRIRTPHVNALQLRRSRGRLLRGPGRGDPAGGADGRRASEGGQRGCLRLHPAGKLDPSAGQHPRLRDLAASARDHGRLIRAMFLPQPICIRSEYDLGWLSCL